jgi:hypothetical protein
MDIRETGWSDVDWTDLALDRDLWRVFVSMVINKILHKILESS